MKIERVNSKGGLMAVWSVTLSCGTTFTMLSKDSRTPEQVAASIVERFPRERKTCGVSQDVKHS